jgi:hypothetical protein
MRVTCGLSPSAVSFTLFQKGSGCKEINREYNVFLDFYKTLLETLFISSKTMAILY